jgi:hypothetical protein
MRLLDQVAQSRAPVMLALDRATLKPIAVTGPDHYSRHLADCPLRYVLGDDLTHAAAQLAFAEGDRLASCLDLVHIPATRLWVEWSDEVHKQVIYETGSAASLDTDARGRRVGVFIEATPCGRAGIARTFWSDAPVADGPGVTLSPIETHIELRDVRGASTGVKDLLQGGLARVSHGIDPAMDTLLDCARFGFDARWAAYYRQAARTEESKRAAVNGSLAAVVRDVPLLLAFFLLLDARDATTSVSIVRDAVNQKRRRHGRPPLLDHVEVRASLERLPTAQESGQTRGERRAPRLHHVRGHLVRRGTSVFWRSPHVRGRVSLGAVRTRTVCLAFERRPAAQDSSHPSNTFAHSM